MLISREYDSADDVDSDVYLGTCQGGDLGARSRRNRKEHKCKDDCAGQRGEG